MTREQAEHVLESCVEDLASIEHARWAHWQKYLHGKGQRQADGSLLLPAELVDHWERQARTAYEELSSEEKQSDRDQVNKYLPLLARKLSEG
ncbi:MAG: hypothetical protein ABI286_00815 [Edaphobacter sp.]